MKLESDWRIFADYMVYKVQTLYLYGLAFKMSKYDAVSFLFPQSLISSTNKQRWIDWITPFVQKSPIPIVHVYDFLWWCSYGLKYQHDLNRLILKLIQELDVLIIPDASLIGSYIRLSFYCRVFYNYEMDSEMKNGKHFQQWSHIYGQVPEHVTKRLINFYDTISFSQWSYKYHSRYEMKFYRKQSSKLRILITKNM